MRPKRKSWSWAIQRQIVESETVEKVQTCSAFTRVNAPYHFGGFEIYGAQVFWRVDY